VKHRAARKHGRRGTRGGTRIRARRALLLLFGCAVLSAAVSAQAKPTAPVVLVARVVSTDAVSGTARVEIAAQSLIKADAVVVKCELPRGAAIVPGSGGWTTDRQGRQVLSMRLALPPDGGKLIIKAELRGNQIKTGVTAGLALPRPGAPGHAKTPTLPKTPPRIIKTSRGERLRLHK